MSPQPSRRSELVVTSRNLKCLRVLWRMEICADLQDELAELYDRLEHAVVVDSAEVPRSVVTMDSRVLCFDPEQKSSREILLVYPWNAAPYAGRVSVASSLGTALLGASIGKSVRYRVDAERAARLEIVDVLYQPERAGHVA